MTAQVRVETRGEVAVITMDNPPLNVLGAGVPEGVAAAVRRAQDDDAIRAIVLTGAGRHFAAGADIRSFTLPLEQIPDLVGMIDAVANATKPIVAALHGTVFGGGLELALACHYRVATGAAWLGQPEVKLGLLPGAGGTQRLPRLVGLRAALQMITTGAPVSSGQAHDLGLVDSLIDGDLLEGAVAFARLAATRGNLPRASDRTVTADGPVAQILAEARAQAQSKARGLLAVLRCIDAVEAAVALPFDQGIQRERELFAQLLASEQSKALRHVFFAERQAAKVRDVSSAEQPLEVRRAAVIGAGTMGGGIAMTFANAGIPVTLVDVDQQSLDRGLRTITRNYQRTVDNGRLSADQMSERLDRIAPVVGYDDVAAADLVIEAVFEDLDVKRDVFRRLDGIVRDGAVLATNTSTLDVNAIAAATSRPEAVVGLHFFSPANVMRLLEVVRGARTSPHVLRTAVALGKCLGKVPVVVGVCDGFVGNRMFDAYTREASILVEDGALPEQVDRVMTDFGFAMGPFAVGDLAGLDIGYRIRQRLAARRAPDERYPTIDDRIVELGRLGQKTGAGFYRYDETGRSPSPDPEITELIVTHSRELGIVRREFSDAEIRTRLLYQLVNEGAKILQEGIAQRSGDIDVIYVHGYGFPAYRGGPMFAAGLEGLHQVLASVRDFAQQFGARWRPAPLLVELAARSQTFEDFQPPS